MIGCAWNDKENVKVAILALWGIMKVPPKWHNEELDGRTRKLGNKTYSDLARVAAWFLCILQACSCIRASASLLLPVMLCI